MDDILKFLNSHASVRKFTDRPITVEDEETIIKTAQRSPTSSNLQVYSIIGIRNQETKEEFAVLSGNQDHIKQCPLFLIFCADLHRLALINKKKGYPFHGEYTEMFIIATVDCTLVAGRALMAAQALGLGGVMVGAIHNDPEKVSRLLALPEFVFPVMGMSLGYPAVPPKIKPRLPLKAIYHKEKYSDNDIDTYLQEYDKTIDESGYLKGREITPEKYPDFKGLYSWQEHTARRMASEEKLSLRPFMKSFLKEKGFMKK
ncbi:MAG: NADPH-dependent oxidoreductase [FCB group bacterium]|nr:NADPH-dependent oxidoreductase [FCB group bacterium]